MNEGLMRCLNPGKHAFDVFLITKLERLVHDQKELMLCEFILLK